MDNAGNEVYRVLELSVYPRVGICRSESDTDDKLSFLPSIKNVVFITIFLLSPKFF